jgi:hypothetical protein
VKGKNEEFGEWTGLRRRDEAQRVEEMRGSHRLGLLLFHFPRQFSSAFSPGRQGHGTNAVRGGCLSAWGINLGDVLPCCLIGHYEERRRTVRE